ncbi:MAG TPA: ABC transporter ATP-binding protein/permease [Gammaproteobacteria bacterium]|nr:ABC transporter ATP-binding protein/permease [Gammaproteobacteria bacterium]
MTAANDPNSAANLGEAPQTGALRQARMILGAIAASPVGRRVVVLVSLLVVAILVTSAGQVVLNRWQKPFYDAITRRDLNDFLYQLLVYFAIVGSLLFLDVSQRWLTETFKFRLREGLTRDLVRLWMAPRRAFWLATSGGPMGVNPDQRMSEDANKLCDISTDLSIGLFRSGVLLVSFAGVLWTISEDFTFRVNGIDYAVPGFMLWAAISYAVVGSLLSYRVGRSLVRLNADRYAREADLRFSLVRVSEHLDGIALAAGEADEQRRVETHLGNVMIAMRRLVRGLTNLTWVTAGFGWITGIAPILIAAPLYFGGKTTFGGMMMAAAAFTQAQDSLRWFVDNFGALADWRATLLRVANFRAALLATESAHDSGSRIEYVEGAPGAIAFDDLQVDSPVGREGFDERHVAIRSGEHVLICGAPGEGKTPFFRALSGLWPWGSGRITRPRGESVMYVPRGTPYLPRGTLREVLAYPQVTDRFLDRAYVTALERTGLARYSRHLDESRRWDRELSEDEQMALTLSRVVLHAPPWVVFDDTFSAMEDETLERVVDMFMRDVTRTTIIHIGRSTQAHLPLFSRVLHLTRLGAKADERTHGLAERVRGRRAR